MDDDWLKMIERCEGRYSLEHITLDLSVGVKKNDEGIIKTKYCPLIAYPEHEEKICKYQGNGLERIDGGGVTMNYKCLHIKNG